MELVSYRQKFDVHEETEMADRPSTSPDDDVFVSSDDYFHVVGGNFRSVGLPVQPHSKGSMPDTACSYCCQFTVLPGRTVPRPSTRPSHALSYNSFTAVNEYIINHPSFMQHFFACFIL